jgi:hypothetical protein
VGAGIPLYHLHQRKIQPGKPLKTWIWFIQPRFKLSLSYFIRVEAQGDGWLERLHIHILKKGCPKPGRPFGNPGFSKLLPRRSEWQSAIC